MPRYSETEAGTSKLWERVAGTSQRIFRRDSVYHDTEILSRRGQGKTPSLVGEGQHRGRGSDRGRRGRGQREAEEQMVKSREGRGVSEENQQNSAGHCHPLRRENVGP